MMDEYDLEKMGRQMNIEESGNQKGEDMQSVITQDRLKKFNEIQGGYESGAQEEEEEVNLMGDDVSNPNEGEEEHRDEVHSLKAKQQSVISQALLKSKIKSRGGDDGASVVSGISKQSSMKRTVISANGSVKTSKTYISHLER